MFDVRRGREQNGTHVYQVVKTTTNALGKTAGQLYQAGI
jgi:hypothetical protein